MRNGLYLLPVVLLVGLAACAETSGSAGRSAPRVTFSGPGYITIKHDPVESGPPPFEVLAMAERYCSAANKHAKIPPHGRTINATAFVCVAEREAAQ